MRRTLIGSLVVLALAACTVPTNDEPQEIAIEDVPSVLLETTTTSTTTTSPAATKDERLWFLRTEDTATVLAPVIRQFDLNDDLNEILANLINVPPDAENPLESGLSSALVPESVQLIGVTIDPETETASINLSGLVGSLRDPLLSRAIAQLVFTATEDPDVRQVTFLNDGVPVDDVGSTSERVVDRLDFQQLVG